MKIYKKNIEKETLNNKFYRRVVHTTKQMQLVLMFIPTGQDIPEEVHEHTTQFIRVEFGTGVAYVSGKMFRLKDGDSIIIPAGAKHHIISTNDLSIYTIYSPPEHAPNKKQKYK